MIKIGILFPFFLIFCGLLSAQEHVLSIAVVKPQKVNAKISSALLQGDTALFFSLLQTDPKLVHASVVDADVQGNYGITFKQPQSILHYLVRKVLFENGSIDLVSQFLTFKPDLAVEFDKKSVLYFLLHHVATHPINESVLAESLIRMLCDQSNINVNQAYSDYLPPLPFILRTNYSFLGKKYDERYVNEDLIILLIQKGANVNTFDQSENNLTTFSVQGHAKKLFQYLQRNGGSFNNQNKDGKDAFYFAVQGNDINAVKQIIASDYEITVDKLFELRISDAITKSNTGMLDYLADVLLQKIQTYSDLIKFIQLFDERKEMILTKNIYKQINLLTDKLPEFVKLFETGGIVSNVENRDKLQQLKIQYLNSTSTIQDFAKRLTVFPILTIQNNTNDFYANLSTTNGLRKEVESFDNKLLFPSTKIALINDINQKRTSAQKLETDYVTWSTANPNHFDKLARIAFNVSSGMDYLFLIEQFKSYLLSLQRESLSIIGVYSKKIVLSVYGYGVKDNKGVFCVQWYREGIMGDGNFLAVNTGFSAFDEKATSYLQQSGATNIAANYLGSTEYDDEQIRRQKAFKQKQCNDCVPDPKKTEWPREVEKSHIFAGTYTSKEYGIIEMQNGMKYSWDRTKNGKWVYVEDGFLGDRVEFDTFEKMLFRLLELCQLRHCKK